MECGGCSQVVEIRWKEEHRLEECDGPPDANIPVVIFLKHTQLKTHDYIVIVLKTCILITCLMKMNLFL